MSSSDGSDNQSPNNPNPEAHRNQEQGPNPNQNEFLNTNLGHFRVERDETGRVNKVEGDIFRVDLGEDRFFGVGSYRYERKETKNGPKRHPKRSDNAEFTNNAEPSKLSKKELKKDRHKERKERHREWRGYSFE